MLFFKVSFQNEQKEQSSSKKRFYRNFYKSPPVKDTPWEKSPSNKIPALTKNMEIDILVFGTSKQLVIRGS